MFTRRALFAGLVFVSSLAVTVDALAETYGFVRQWGVTWPTSLALDRYTRVYVAEFGASSLCRVEKFSNAGEYLTQWGNCGQSVRQFYWPTGIAVAPSGDVYVSEGYGNYRIQRFTFYGAYLGQWGTRGWGEGQFQDASDVAVDGEGNVYVADYRRIQKFDATGTFLTQWFPFGANPNELWSSSAVAVDAENHVNVIVNRSVRTPLPSGYDTTLYLGSRVQKFDSNGSFIREWGTLGSGPGQFDSPSGLAADMHGAVYVADTRNRRIQKFDSEGQFVTEWGTWGSEPGEFHWPEDVAVDSNGEVYVIDGGNARIQVFAPLDVTPTMTTLWGALKARYR